MTDEPDTDQPPEPDEPAGDDADESDNPDLVPPVIAGANLRSVTDTFA